ncbi:hypothetical protein PM082_014640 [Marasmius tenuissimus]|nr:hypothetical protein PM082_014640 [Marasmius tenuissimus]
MQSLLNDYFQNHAYPTETLDTTKSPWVLSQVSQRWRNLALASPCLWSSFDINWIPRRIPKPRDLLSIDTLLSLQLNRCCDQPLSVSWYHDCCDMEILRRLCSKADQWTKVTLRVRKSSFETLLDYRGRFLNITNLHLRIEVGDEGVWDEQSSWQREYGYLAGLFQNGTKRNKTASTDDFWRQCCDATHHLGNPLETNHALHCDRRWFKREFGRTPLQNLTPLGEHGGVPSGSIVLRVRAESPDWLYHASSPTLSGDVA